MISNKIEYAILTVSTMLVGTRLASYQIEEGSTEILFSAPERLNLPKSVQVAVSGNLEVRLPSSCGLDGVLNELALDSPWGLIDHEVIATTINFSKQLEVRFDNDWVLVLGGSESSKEAWSISAEASIPVTGSEWHVVLLDSGDITSRMPDPH